MDAIKLVELSCSSAISGGRFNDGHSEIHKWTAWWIRQPIQATKINDYDLKANNDSPQDAYWLDLHAVGTGSFP